MSICRRVGLLVAFGSAVLLVAGCSDDTFDHQYPKADVNVSLEKALRDHRVGLPAGAQGVRYSANSELEGYPLFLEFEAPCSEMGAFSGKNGLERLPMEKMWGTNAAVEAQESGWRHRKGDYGFRRDSGTSVTRIHALVSPRGSDCHVWVDN